MSIWAFMVSVGSFEYDVQSLIGSYLQNASKKLRLRRYCDNALTEVVRYDKV
jgi:hypothetical protein